MGERRLFRQARVRSTESGDIEATTTPVEDVPKPLVPDECTVRSPLTVQGVISEVVLGSRGDAPALEASIDATNVETGEPEQLVLVWLGRREIAGIYPGREIVATARICVETGARVMYNPRYDLR